MKLAAATIHEAIDAFLTERKLFVVRPQHPTMGEVALEHYGFGRACDAVALQGDDLQGLLAEIGDRCAAALVSSGLPVSRGARCGDEDPGTGETPEGLHAVAAGTGPACEGKQA